MIPRNTESGGRRNVSDGLPLPYNPRFFRRTLVFPACGTI
ncbi:hypothetical protein HMPREF9120_01733 [Neisseria sp. oral taxon 020 str. F0370]|nr:hypothetical protein HMPREF9120_01733 [Neisseria sp. oral taxon 020 str. F0370]